MAAGTTPSSPAFLVSGSGVLGARFLRLASWPLGCGIAGWGLVSAGLGLGSIAALGSAGWGSKGAELPALVIVSIVMMANGGSLIIVGTPVVLVIAHFRSRTTEVLAGIRDAQCQKWVHVARRCSLGALFSLGMLALALGLLAAGLPVGAAICAAPVIFLLPGTVPGWHIAAVGICVRIAACTGDPELKRLQADLQRRGWVLLGEVAGFPVVVGVLYGNGFGSRFIGIIGALVLGFVGYALWGLFTVVRRAATVLAQSDIAGVRGTDHS